MNDFPCSFSSPDSDSNTIQESSDVFHGPSFADMLRVDSTGSIKQQAGWGNLHKGSISLLYLPY